MCDSFFNIFLIYAFVVVCRSILSIWPGHPIIECLVYLLNFTQWGADFVCAWFGFSTRNKRDPNGNFVLPWLCLENLEWAVWWRVVVCVSSPHHAAAAIVVVVYAKCKASWRHSQRRKNNKHIRARHRYCGWWLWDKRMPCVCVLAREQIVHINTENNRWVASFGACGCFPIHLGNYININFCHIEYLFRQFFFYRLLPFASTFFAVVA